jgi:hypothetical protein
LSESAESAFEYAKEQFKLAGEKKSKITLLKVIDVVPLAGIQIEYGLAIADKNRLKLHKQSSDKIRGIAKNIMERSLFRREPIYCILELR